MRRVVTIFLLKQTTRLGGPLRYLEHVCKVYRKFSRGLWKKSFTSEKWSFFRIFQPHFEFHFFPIFWGEIFLRASRNFLWTLRTFSRYLQGPPDLVLDVSKNVVAARHTNEIICQEKWKKFRLWKMKVKVSLENSDKTSCFELRLFFKCH